MRKKILGSRKRAGEAPSGWYNARGELVSGAAIDQANGFREGHPGEQSPGAEGRWKESSFMDCARCGLRLQRFLFELHEVRDELGELTGQCVPEEQLPLVFGAHCWDRARFPRWYSISDHGLTKARDALLLAMHAGDASEWQLRCVRLWKERPETAWDLVRLAAMQDVGAEGPSDVH